jgi:hypothetical protein
MMLSIALIEWACNTRIEGCLDPNASNFDFTAEKDCNGCCTYPFMTITLSQKWNSENFSIEDTLYDLNQNPYQIVDIRYFLSSWTWKGLDNSVYTVDSTEADCAGNKLRYTKDINAIEPRIFIYLLGNYRQAPVIDSVNFHMGLVEDFECLEDTLSSTPDILTPASPLWNPDTEELSTMRLIVNRNIVDSVFDTVFIDLHRFFSIGYPHPFDRGADYSFLVTVNYAMWFQQVNIADLNSFGFSVAQGLDGSFTRTQ